ncbi:hypothetical protein TIFTF001_045153 [Ficus carica]|uniref:Uncharacterized protein n=1 Tax=Ficus carica TaxID=3494 RepID=A0AA87YP69_FICCA|nr:hypothetical protein TIFTF001_045153 [Ficus carica]
MDSGGRLQNHLKTAPFKLCAKSLYIMSSSMSVGMGVSRTPRARSLNPGFKVVALYSCEEKLCSIYASNVLISSDIMFRIISSTFIIPGGTGPSSGGGKSGVERRVEVVCLLELDPCAGCCYCTCLSFAIGVFPGVDRGYIGATGLCKVFRTP